MIVGLSVLQHNGKMKHTLEWDLACNREMNSYLLITYHMPTIKDWTLDQAVNETTSVILSQLQAFHLKTQMRKTKKA